MGPQPMDKTAVGGFYEGIVAGLPGSQIKLLDTFGAEDRIVTGSSSADATTAS